MDFVHPIAALVPGAQGRILEVLVGTTSELSVRTVARLAGVSPAQASRVLPALVESGIVERREVPPSSQFRLVRSHVAAQALLSLARSRESALEQIGASAAALPVPPLSVVVFGSFARGEAGSQSDIDIVVVRPDGVGEDDETWAACIETWRGQIRTMTGNRVEVLETTRGEAATKLRGRGALWRDVAREGLLVHGLALDVLREEVHA